MARSVEILLVEDNPGDIALTKEALEEGKVRNNLTAARDGEEALRYLRQEGEYAGVPRPDLVLLDLNLPRLGGREVLEAIRADPVIRHVPVVVLSSSRRDEDVLASYGLHANCYVSKPLEVDQFIDVVRSIEQFWVSIVTLPPSS